jgi:hypothetical protein
MLPVVMMLEVCLPEQKESFAFPQLRTVDYEMVLRVPKLKTADALAACSRSRLVCLAAVECVQTWPRF